MLEFVIQIERIINRILNKKKLSGFAEFGTKDIELAKNLIVNGYIKFHNGYYQYCHKHSIIEQVQLIKESGLKCDFESRNFNAREIVFALIIIYWRLFLLKFFLNEVWNINLSKEANEFKADPFWLSDSVIVYESLNDNKGIIVAENVSNGEVLDTIVEPFHLSFPYPFNLDGKKMIVTESTASGHIQIYEWKNNRFDKVKILSGRLAIDPVVVEDKKYFICKDSEVLIIYTTEDFSNKKIIAIELNSNLDVISERVIYQGIDVLRFAGRIDYDFVLVQVPKDHKYGGKVGSVKLSELLKGDYSIKDYFLPLKGFAVHHIDGSHSKCALYDYRLDR